jgi:hypothetical protein
MTRQLLRLKRTLIALSACTVLFGLSACSDDGDPGGTGNSSAEQDAGSEDTDSQDTNPTDSSSPDTDGDTDSDHCGGAAPYADCSQTGCADGLTCIFAEDVCVPNHCTCEDGQWLCTRDCTVGGHVCVEDPDYCADENLPSSDCRDYGCDDDETCAPADGCQSSNCSCDPVDQTMACTGDCGERYECVADTGETCDEPNPAGCEQTGCDDGEVCAPSDDCIPSHCECNGSDWMCTRDCGGGVCITKSDTCDEPNPAGCTQEGCPSGETCQTDPNECAPSQCNCSDGQWVCTRDCGGGGTCQ